MKDLKYFKLESDDLKILRKIELGILKNVLLAINKMKLNYFVVGGTALGAYKYSSFIPWDDDIDIAMPREDYKRFISEGHNYLPDYLSIQSLYTDKNYTLGVTKIRDERTTFFDIYTAQYKISHGVFIDIFPIDKCGNIDPNKKFLYRMRENRIAWSNYYKPDNAFFKNKIKAFLCKCLLFFESPHKCALKNDRYLEKLNSKCNGNKVFMRIEIHDGGFFESNTPLKFEDINVFGPNSVETYLSRCYGDISVEPPQELQIPHHFVLLFSSTESYKNYYFYKGEVLPKV